MIVDCYTQIRDSSIQPRMAAPSLVQPAVEAYTARHLEAADPVDRMIVLAFKSRYVETEVPNQFVADYVRRNAPKMVGFAGIDPTERDWQEELRIAQEELHLKGVLVSPALQNYHPVDTRAMKLYSECGNHQPRRSRGPQ